MALNDGGDDKCGGGDVGSRANCSSITKARAILNGVVGDYLEDTKNELAIEMELYRSAIGGEPVVASSDFSPGAERICILVHGLTDDESVWTQDNGDEDDDYGKSLQRDLGVTPLYLRYNTGMHVSVNGRKLSALLDSLLRSSPAREIVFICHSMGGLVVRSACLHAQNSMSSWVRRVRHIIFLGTPHHGSHWEKLGNVVSSALGAVPRPYMKLAADVANLRSAGIKDLRHGYVLDEDWENQNPDAFLDNTKKSAGSNLLSWAKYFAVTGTVTANPNHPVSVAIGDALVRKASAEGRHHDEELDLKLSPDLIREFAGVGHTQLSSHPDVYEQIREWVSQPWEGAPPPDELQQCDASDPILRDAVDERQHTNAANVNGKWAKCRGAATLVQTAVDRGATAIEGVQHDLTNEVYGVIAQVPPLAPAAKSVHTVHEACVGGIFGIIRGVNYGAGEIAKIVFDKMEEREVAAGSDIAGTI